MTWEIVLCPVCGETIHRHFAAPISTRARIHSRSSSQSTAGMLTDMVRTANELHEETVLRAEMACASHFRSRHALRFSLWHRLRWNWLINKRFPWSRRAELDSFDYSRVA